jgi:hypothetical protein
MSGNAHPEGPRKAVPQKTIPYKDIPDEPPPMLGTWGHVYAFAMVELAVVIGLFYWFTIAFQP